MLAIYTRFRQPVEYIVEPSPWRRTDQYSSRDLTTHSQAEICGREQRHVVFIKVHKAGSSTIANILFRFGFSRNLTFLMPAREVTVSLHLSEPWKNILPVPPGADHYDILSNHAVYEKSEIKRLFPADRVILAVLRTPMGHLESSMYYYYKNQYDGNDDKVGAYLKNPELLKGDRYINNSMAYELGVPRQQFFNESFVLAHAEVISKEIDFVMILERLDESLVLLKRRLCWQLQDIIYIIRNVNKKKPHIQRTDEELEKLKAMMPAHFVLYNFFYKKLQREISAAAGLQEEVTHFKTLLRLVSDFCQEAFTSAKYLELPGSKWNKRSVIPRHDCVVLQLNGAEILRHARLYQYGDNWQDYRPPSAESLP